MSITHPYSNRRPRTPLVLALATIVLSACGHPAPESDGVIASVDGEVRKLSSDETKTVCATQYCEPNYIYTTSFGRKKPKPTPAPTPTPTPSPKPTPSPSPSPSPISSPITDQLDYSRTKLNVQEAWKITQGSSDVVVAVIDTGVDYTHPDLKDNVASTIINGSVTHGYDFTRGTTDAMDDNEHGTHCSGIIGAELNGIGIVGISPKVKILPVKFLDSQGSGTTENAIKAVRYAVDQGAKVLSMSWGGAGESQLLAAEIKRAVDLGVYVVAAAGNDTSNNDSVGSFPANYPGVIAVGSTDEQDKMSYFSNYGPQHVFIGAPGSNILSTIPGGQYAKLSGTSMATPQVSGAIALALSISGSMTPAQLKAKLCDSSDKILTQDFACGRMNVGKLIQSLH